MTVAVRLKRSWRGIHSDLSQRFHSRVKKLGPSDCWEWTGAVDTNGRGQMGYTDPTGTPRLARIPRLAYEIFVEVPPPNLEVCHTCDNGRCVNPKHLYLGTHQQNMTDRAVRERGGNNRLTADKVREIRARRASGAKLNDLAVEFGVHIVTISDAVKRVTWAHVA